MLSTKLKEAAGNSADATLYVDDVFSTYLYTGNNSTQTITNGIDLAGKGGLVWLKKRSAADSHFQFDTARGSNYALFSELTNAQDTGYSPYFSFGSSGFNLTGSVVANTNAATYASWTFRKAAKFFDVVTWTGDGAASRAIPHNLGIQAGFLVCKRTDTTGGWPATHRRGGTQGFYGMELNTTGLGYDWPDYNTYITSTTFDPTQLAGGMNISGATYVAYLFAHDTAADGIIQCGSYTGNGSTTGPIVNLGWEPQYVMVKAATDSFGWYIFDSMRGLRNKGGVFLTANTSAAEDSSVNIISALATGFQPVQTGGATNFNGVEYVYMAIRRPNKPPTSGTQVFGLNARTGTGANATVTGGQTDDAVLIKNRGAAVADLFSSRLTGTGYLVTSSTAAEVAAGTTILQANPWDVMDGVKVGTTSTITNASANTFINYLFKRAPGFFDVVCYTGTGSATTQAHNLTVVPEIIIVKQRNNLNNWFTYFSPIGISYYVRLDLTNPAAGDSGTDWNTTLPTSTVFSIGTSVNVNASAQTYVAYLFATLAGIQYINSYVGDGTTGRVINCGFSAGARFICIKATSTTGSWWVWDSARGITSTNDPVLQLNSTAAEITSADAIDPSSSGFIVNQEATCSINASGVSYLVWAIA